jgi:hypothetical protein
MSVELVKDRKKNDQGMLRNFEGIDDCRFQMEWSKEKCTEMITPFLSQFSSKDGCWGCF